MYCPRCGTMNDDRAASCSRCAVPLTPVVAPTVSLQSVPGMQPFSQQVPTYMTQAVLITLFCCMPLGFAAIFKANKVKKLLQQNDVAGALKASNENKIMLWIGFGVGFVITLFYVIGALNKT